MSRGAPIACPGPVAALLLLGLLAGGCSSGEAQRPPNVVLLVLDTVRADHIGCYGYPGAATPFLDELAGTADRYSVVESTAPWTLPSHASMFTGRFPFQHGAHAGRAADGRIFDARPLDAAQPTLAETLGACGYRSAAFIANSAYLSEVFALDRGFDSYQVERMPAAQVNGRFFQWLAARDADQSGGESPPFFAFLNYMDAHRPYNTEPLPAPRGELLPAPDPAPSGELLDELYQSVMGRGEAPDAQLVARITGQYDNGIAWLDQAVEEVARQLRARGLWDETLLVVTSDHGEFLGEHGLVEHSKDLYQEAVRVPLLIKRPGQTTGRLLEQRTSLAALPGLILLELPDRLRERHAGSFPLFDELSGVMSEIHFTRGKDLKQPWGARFQRERFALYVDRYKFILSTDGDNELFDLQADPGESSNLIGEKPVLAAALEGRMQAMLATGASANLDFQAPVLSEAQLEEMRRLGYL